LANHAGTSAKLANRIAVAAAPAIIVTIPAINDRMNPQTDLGLGGIAGPGTGPGIGPPIIGPPNIGGPGGKGGGPMGAGGNAGAGGATIGDIVG